MDLGGSAHDTSIKVNSTELFTLGCLPRTLLIIQIWILRCSVMTLKTTSTNAFTLIRGLIII